MKPSDIGAAVIVALLLLMLGDKVNAQAQYYIPGTSTTPGAMPSTQPYTGFAQVMTVDSVSRCDAAKRCTVLYYVGADYTLQSVRYRAYGTATRQYKRGEMVRVVNGALAL